MNNYYIYIYLDPREFGRYCYENFSFLYKPFYVGKGKDDRFKSNCGRNDDFINIINEIKKIGLQLIKFKIYENLNEEQSLKIEKQLIEEIGRIESGTGYLINRTSGGQGTSGFKHSEETKELMSESKRKIFQEIKKEFERRDYILLSEENEYKNNYDTKLKYICPRGHESSINWHNFQQGYGCPYCAKVKIDFSDIEKEFERRDYILLSEEKDYETNKTKLKYICPEGHTDYITWGNFQQGRGCSIKGIKIGHEKQRKNFQDIKKEFEKRDYILLSKEEEYKNANKTKLKYICPRGRKGSISWHSFQQKFKNKI